VVSSGARIVPRRVKAQVTFGVAARADYFAPFVPQGKRVNRAKEERHNGILSKRNVAVGRSQMSALVEMRGKKTREGVLIS